MSNMEVVNAENAALQGIKHNLPPKKETERNLLMLRFIKYIRFFRKGLHPIVINAQHPNVFLTEYCQYNFQCLARHNRKYTFLHLIALFDALNKEKHINLERFASFLDTFYGSDLWYLLVVKHITEGYKYNHLAMKIDQKKFFLHRNF
jgi:hypothetical protein